MTKIPVVSVIGRPNVGKSTLFNKIIGKRLSIVDATAGTTRDRVAQLTTWNNKPFVLLDTAGLIVDFYGFEEAEIEKKAQIQIEQSIKESDAVMLVVDIKRGLAPEDEQIAKIARRFDKRIILVCNKADSLEWERKNTEFSKLGFDEIVYVSAAVGRRMGILLDSLTRDFKEIKLEENKIKKVAIIGRPNVGKSSLFNALCDDEIAIVSDIAGTTRDAIKVEVNLGGSEAKSFEIIDTAGFRRRGKIAPGIEKFSIYRSIDSIVAADLVLLVMDGAQGLTRQDAHLCELALNNGKKIIVVLNKIDLLKKQITDEIENLFRFPFLNKQKTIAVSAKTGQNLNLLVREIVHEL